MNSNRPWPDRGRKYSTVHTRNWSRFRLRTGRGHLVRSVHVRHCPSGRLCFDYDPTYLLKLISVSDDVDMTLYILLASFAGPGASKLPNCAVRRTLMYRRDRPRVACVTD